MIAYGIISTQKNPTPRVAVRVGAQIIDLAKLIEIGKLDETYLNDFISPNLNNLIGRGQKLRQIIKQQVMQIISQETRAPTDLIFNQEEVTLHHPLAIGGFTDFYTSKQHATNIGKIFRPQNPLLPNWQHLPIAYNGRASSVVISGYPVKRPQGQILVGESPEFSFCKKLDFEVELGVVIGKDSKLGEPIDVNQADDYIFGICLLNDWSARDLQAWEYQPLGPFTSKSFLTSISAFIIPIEELSDYKTKLATQNPKPMAYLNDANPHGYDIELRVILKTTNYPEGVLISTTNFKYVYWSIRQWIAHHTVSGCNLKIGDILASGTISGDEKNSLGSLMELTVNGSDPIKLPNGEQRSFLENGDELIIEGYAGSQSLGVVSGKITT